VTRAALVGMQTVFHSFGKLGAHPLFVDYTYVVPWPVYHRVNVFSESVVSGTDSGKYPMTFHATSQTIGAIH
jgi:hypothetical protein